MDGQCREKQQERKKNQIQGTSKHQPNLRNLFLRLGHSLELSLDSGVDLTLIMVIKPHSNQAPRGEIQ